MLISSTSFLLVVVVEVVAAMPEWIALPRMEWNLETEPTRTTVTAVLLLLLCVYFYYYYQQQQQQSLSHRLGMPVLHHPPQGRSWPFLGQALNCTRYRPWDLMTQWHQQYGPAVAFSLLGSTYFSVASPALLKQLLQSKIAAVKKDVAGTMKDFLVILGTGIVTSENQKWIRQRLKMSHPLRHDVLEIIPRQTLVAIQHLFQKLDNATEPVPLGALLRHLTLQVISGSFLSLTAEESDSSFAKLYLPIVDESNTRVWHPYRRYLAFMPFWWRYRWNVHRLNAYVSSLIVQRWCQRREEAAAGYTKRATDILDRVLAVYEKECVTTTTTNNDDDDSLLPDTLPPAQVRQFRDEMKTFMLAGHETSAAMMTWALYELILDQNNHSEDDDDDDKDQKSLMQSLRTEASHVFSKTSDWSQAQATDLPDTSSSLSKLVLAEACLKEALRKYSVVPCVARRTIADLTLLDDKDHHHQYHIPAGSPVIINIQAVHLNPDLWPQPHQYKPDRFLPPHSNRLEPFTFLPFIAGPRNCLGQHLALLESKMVISLLVQRYHLEFFNKEDWKEDDDPRHRYMIPVIPKRELLVRVQRRGTS